MIVDDIYYQSVFSATVTALTLFCSRQMSNWDYERVRENANNTKFAFFVCVIYAVWFGLRTPFGSIFGDTVNYTADYLVFRKYPTFGEHTGDVLWKYFTWVCARNVDISVYYTIVAAGYFGFSFWACKRLTPNNVLASFLFILGAFSFYTYSVNGIRNGLACSIVLLVLTYMTGRKKDYIIAAILGVMALNIHKSTLLPLGMMVLSEFWIKQFKTAYTFWLLSIPLSLVAGGALTALLAGIGYDGRESYLVSTDSLDRFKSTGFRWDFLVYSMMPILLGYYVVIKKKVQDRMYLLLLNTYTLTNAFWVIIIRAAYSNRFAYLSWFMYGLVLAYPLLRLDVWGDRQGMMLKRIMWAQLGFTLFMEIVYYG